MRLRLKQSQEKVVNKRERVRTEPECPKSVYTRDFSCDFECGFDTLRTKAAPAYPARVFSRVTLPQAKLAEVG